MRRIAWMVLMASVSLCCAGCGKEPAGPDGRILAKINTYELTVADFNDEARLTLSNKFLSGDPKIAKEELLDEIITKKLLLQEAQRQNFDKDKSFMKEIERYWEQALIKLMVRKKTDELSRSIFVNEREIREEYDRLAKGSEGRIPPFEAMAPDIKDDIYSGKMQKLFDEWLAILRERSDIEIHRENL